MATSDAKGSYSGEKISAYLIGHFTWKQTSVYLLAFKNLSLIVVLRDSFKNRLGQMMDVFAI